MLWACNRRNFPNFVVPILRCVLAWILLSKQWTNISAHHEEWSENVWGNFNLVAFDVFASFFFGRALTSSAFMKNKSCLSSFFEKVWHVGFFFDLTSTVYSAKFFRQILKILRIWEKMLLHILCFSKNEAIWDADWNLSCALKSQK